MIRPLRAFALIGAGAGVLGALAGCHGERSGDTTKAEAKPQAVPVTVAPLEHRQVLRTVDVVGTLAGWEDVTIGAKRDGRVLKVLHDMGDRVEPGALLVQLETEDADLEILQAQRQLEAELARLGLKELPQGDFDVATIPSVVQARVALDRAKQNLARERSLMQRNAGTLQDLQNSENDERSAEAALANAILTANSTLASAQSARVAIDVARHKRAEMQIHAPTPSVPPEGVTGPVTYAISKREVSEGQMLRQGDAVAELVIEDPLRLRASVPERHSGEIKVEQTVGLMVGAHPGTIFEGRIARINPSVDATSRTFQVEAIVPNSRGLLRPGGFAKASIVINRNAEATVVPIESVSTFAGVTKVFVVENDQARAVPVSTGIQGEGWVEVIGDLPREARVVTTGQTRLAEGTPVVVRTPETPTRVAEQAESPEASHKGAEEPRPVARAERDTR